MNPILLQVVLRVEAYIGLVGALFIFNSHAIEPPSCRATVLGNYLRIPSHIKLIGADTLKSELEVYMTNAPFRVLEEKLDGKSGVSAKKIIFENGIIAILKGTRLKSPEMADAEVAAYRIDRLFKFARVPPTVKRMIDGKPHSLQLFVGNLKDVPSHYFGLDEKELASVVFFDNLISESDRHRGNVGLGPKNQIVLFDHGASFGYGRVDNYYSKSLHMVKMNLRSHELRRFSAISEADLLSSIADLDLPRAKVEALLNRFRVLKTKLLQAR